MMHKGVYILLKKSLLSEWKGGFFKNGLFSYYSTQNANFGDFITKIMRKKIDLEGGGGRKSNIIIIPNLILYF